MTERRLDPRTLAVHGGEPRTPPLRRAGGADRADGDLHLRQHRRARRLHRGPARARGVRPLRQPDGAAGRGEGGGARGRAGRRGVRSGMAAVTTAILALVKQGSHVVLFSDCYRRTRQFVRQVLEPLRGGAHARPSGGPRRACAPRSDPRRGWWSARRRPTPTTRSSISPALDRDLPRAAGQDADRLHLRHADQPAARRARRGPGGPLGHQVPRRAQRRPRRRGRRQARPRSRSCAICGTCSAACIDPHAAYLVHRGLKTLARARRASEPERAGARRGARGAPQGGAGLVPGPRLATRSHDVARELMSGFGGVVTFALGRGPRGRLTLRRRARRSRASRRASAASRASSSSPR